MQEKVASEERRTATKKNKKVRVVKREERALSFTVLEVVNTYLHSPHVLKLEEGTQGEYSKKLRALALWCANHTIIQDQNTKAWTAIESDEQIMLNQINAHVVRLFIEHVKDTGTPHKPGATEISTYTLATYARVIKVFLNWCSCDPEYEHHVNSTVVARIEMPAIEEVIIQPFTDQQLEALFAACDKEKSQHLQLRDKAMLAVMLDTGVRANELVTQQIGNVSLDPRDAYVRVLGKGQKWGEVGLGEQSLRLLQQYLDVYRIPSLESAIREEYDHLSPKQLRKVIDQTIAQEPVFMGRTGVPLSVWGLEQVFMRLGRWAHIEGVRCSPHTMRHSFAVRFWRRTHDIRTLSKLLRHASIKVTEEYLKSILQSEARLGAPSMFDELSNNHTLAFNVSNSNKKRVRSNVIKRNDSHARR